MGVNLSNLFMFTYHTDNIRNPLFHCLKVTSRNCLVLGFECLLNSMNVNDLWKYK